MKAPAKVNLFLHVTGRRANGYHELESLVVFDHTAHDLVTITPDDALRIRLGGRFASSIQPDQNSVLEAARLLPHKGQGAHIHLEKNLPVGAGIGGGSADAAATLRGLNALWQLGLDEAELAALGLRVGADVPVCLYGAPVIMGGVGEVLTPTPPMADFALLLVNPLISISTAAVFSSLNGHENPRAPAVPVLPDANQLARWLARHTRNDLQQAAYELHPELARVRDALEATGAPLVRMSGSGATHFELYAHVEAAREAGSYLHRKHPGWWVNSPDLRNSEPDR